MVKPQSRGVSNVTLIILFFVVIILISAIGTLYFYWMKSQKIVINTNLNESPLNVNLPAEKAELAAFKRLIQPEEIKIEEVKVNPQVPEYNLPLVAEDISNFEDVMNKIVINDEIKAALKQNGFVVTDTPEDFSTTPDDFAEYYSNLKNRELPLFITSDSLLHYYHLFFDTTLMKLERDLFYDDVWQMSQELFTDAQAIYQNTDGDLKVAAKQNVGYLAVALELLKPKSDQVISDETIKSEYCYPEMDKEFCDRVISDIKEQFGSKASYKYFSADDVKKYNFTVPEYVKDLVDKEIALISGHEGFKPSPLFYYKEDYSQYVPRGHYTKTEKLKNYFKAMIWYGRMTALLNGDKNLNPAESECSGFYNGIISEEDAKIQTLQAGLVAKKFLESKELQQRWQRMYAITAYMVGFSDDLGPFEYSEALKAALGDEITNEKLVERYDEFKSKVQELSYNPKIYSGLGACQMAMSCPPLSDEELQSLKVQAKNLLNQTKGFRLMGQRFTLDSYLFSEIVSPYSGKYIGEDKLLPTEEKPFTFSWDDEYENYRDTRPFTWVKTDVAGCEEGREVKGFPSGLDLMAIFGSARAEEILDLANDTKYSDYQKVFNALKQEVNSMPEEGWFQNLYYNWLYVLKGLLGDYGEGYPTFMQSTAWQDKQLNTVLSSWTELRHDTILYVKQSYTIAEMGAGYVPPVVGYVEPVPDFYARLLTLTRMTKLGMEKLVPAEEMENLKISLALERFDDMLSKLIDLSKKELANEALTEDEYSFIESFGASSKSLIEIVAGGDVDPTVLKSILVADVHTDGNTLLVLEEGTGYLKTMLVAYKLPDNRILVGVGPVFSYYEFKQPMKNRLTDEKWREILDSGNYPDEPAWTNSFSK